MTALTNNTFKDAFALLLAGLVFAAAPVASKNPAQAAPTESTGAVDARVDALQSRTVRFDLKAHQLGFWDNTSRFRIEPGTFDLWLGDSSAAGLHTTFFVK
jgi:hypothetical protein